MNTEIQSPYLPALLQTQIPAKGSSASTPWPWHHGCYRSPELSIVGRHSQQPLYFKDCQRGDAHVARAGCGLAKQDALSSACGEGLQPGPAGGDFETHLCSRGHLTRSLRFRHRGTLSSGSVLLLSSLPALLSACLRAPSSVTSEPFPSSCPANCSSLEVSGNSCVCQAAAAVRPKTGPGIWCWATGWCNDFLKQVNSFVSFVPLSPPHFHCTKGKQQTVICLAMWLPLGTKPAICGGPY